MSETIPEDLALVGLLTWIDALRDGTPDAGNIIARALLAERERCASIAERTYESDNLADRSPRHIASAIRTPSTGEEQ